MAAYIDLNGVRAGQVPEEKSEVYAWCGWGQAHRGGEEALVGLCRLLGAGTGRPPQAAALREVQNSLPL